MIRAKPVGPRLLVKPIEATETARNGIVLPAEVGQDERRGVIQDVGDGWFKEFGEDGPVHTPLGVRPGEVVIYEAGAGVEVKLDLEEGGTYEKFLVLHMNEVLLILEEVEVPIGVPD